MAAIDVGSAAIWRTSNYETEDTVLVLDNPANNTGNLTSVEVWAYLDVISLRAGTFYLDSGTTYICRDSAILGAVAEGSKQTFSGLSISVTSGDLMGCYSGIDHQQLRADYTGFAGLRYASGEHIDPSDSANYSLDASWTMSLYGIGATAGPSYIPRHSGSVGVLMF